jgi:hypothetical protein
MVSRKLVIIDLYLPWPRVTYFISNIDCYRVAELFNRQPFAHSRNEALNTLIREKYSGTPA